MKHQFKLKPSTTLLIVMIILHSGTLIICCSLINQLWIRGCLIIILFFHFNLTVRRYVFLIHNSIKEFWQHSSDGIYTISNGFGEAVLATIKYPIFVSTYMIIINFSALHRRGITSVPIFRDALAKDDFRKLQILLLLRR